MCKMRKTRPRQYNTKGGLDADVARTHATIELTDMLESTEGQAMLCDEELLLVIPPWASFELEAKFWELLEKICAAEGMSGQEFVEDVQRRYVGQPIDRAVRIEIATYFFSRRGWAPQEEEVRSWSVHETAVPRL
jgi:hypothetical protein